MDTNDLVTPPPVAPPPVAPVQVPGAAPAVGGCISELGWMAAGFVLPLASFSFYRRAVRRSTGSAVLFFVVFMGIVSLVTTLGVTLQMSRFSSEIRRVFAEGIVPEVTIHNGIATVKGPQPAVLLDSGGTLLVIDTTGQYTEIDPSRYTSGFLLTATDLHVLSSNSGSRVLPLSQLQQAFQEDPLVINAETMSQFWQGFTGIFAILALIGVGFWNLAVRFIYLAILALVLWGVTLLFRPKTPYGVVLAVGVYSFVPVIYLIDIFDRVGRSFFLLQTLLLTIVWLIGLYLALAKDGPGFLGETRPPRAWRALLGVPLLVVMALDAVFAWSNGGYFVLLTLAVTLILLAIAGFLTRPHGEPNPGMPTGDGTGLNNL